MKAGAPPVVVLSFPVSPAALGQALPAAAPTPLTFKSLGQPPLGNSFNCGFQVPLVEYLHVPSAIG